MADQDEIDIEEELKKLSPEQLQKFEFVINEDGSVTFVDFPPELVDLAYALNPDDPLVCERRAAAAEAASPEALKPGAHGKLAGSADGV